MINYKDYIAAVPDFPKEGILFRDVTPLLLNGEVFSSVIDELCEYAKKIGATVIVGSESRGFIFGCPICDRLKLGFVPVRKPGKLPRNVVTEEYSLEYGRNKLNMHDDAIKPGDKALVIDDLLATGGTALACCRLVEKLGGEVVGNAFLIELEDLKGREILKDYDVYSIIKY